MPRTQARITSNKSVYTTRSLWSLLRRFRAGFLLLIAAPLSVGGQAVIEGVMMRSPGSFSVAVRRKHGAIVIREQRVNNFLSRFKPLRWPLLRGAVMLIESMYNGLTALNFAADQAMLDEVQDDKAQDDAAPDKASQPANKNGDKDAQIAKGDPKKESSKSEKAALWGTVCISLLLGLLLFVGLPHGLTYLIGLFVPGGLSLDHAGFHLIDGTIKLGIFIGYILLISRFDDVSRLFMYHGAEHMSVHCYEHKLPLEVEHAKDMSTAHPRCGTSLILWVVAVSIFMFAAVFPFLPKFFANPIANNAAAIFIKILLSLPVAGVAYEVQRAAAKHPDIKWVQAIIKPGMWLQSLTTRQPGPAELEVGLASLRKVLWREQQKPIVGDEAQAIEQFADFADFSRRVEMRTS